MKSEPRAAFLRGVRDSLALLPGVAPFALVFGTIAATSGLAPLISQSSSYLVYAGSAQLIALGLIGGGAPGALIAVTACVLNLRHLIYSASVAPALKDLGWRWKIGLSYLLTDESYAMAIHRLQARQPHAHWTLLGNGMTLWVAWQLTTLLGVLAGTAIPAQWQLEFAVPATFIALVFPALKSRPMLAAAVVGGAVSVLAHALPHKTGLLIAAAAGIMAGMLAKRLARPAPG